MKKDTFGSSPRFEKIKNDSPSPMHYNIERISDFKKQRSASPLVVKRMFSRSPKAKPRGRLEFAIPDSPGPGTLFLT